MSGLAHYEVDCVIVPGVGTSEYVGPPHGLPISPSV